MENKIITILEEDGDDLMFSLPEELMKELDWHIGDTLEWADQGGGSWAIRKKL